MKNRITLFIIIFGLTVNPSFSRPKPLKAKISDETLRKKANELAHKFIIVDGHVDLPYRLHHKMEDVSVQTKGGDFDYVRAKKGGLSAPFMSIYVPADLQKKKGFSERILPMTEVQSSGFILKQSRHWMGVTMHQFDEFFSN